MGCRLLIITRQLLTFGIVTGFYYIVLYYKHLPALKPYCFIFIFIAFAKLSVAQVNDQLLLNRVTTRQGLSNREVKCIFQDSRGFIWIGTYDGLNRYDGRNIKIYRKSLQDTNSLINNWVNSIVEDGSGYIWIGTSNGVSRLNVQTGAFTSYGPVQLFPGQKYLAGEQKVFKDAAGAVWVCSGGLSFYDERSGRFVAQPFIPPTPVHGYSKNQLVGSVAVDSRKNIWMGTPDGLYSYNPASKKYTRYTDKPLDEDYRKNGNTLGCLNIINDSEMLVASWSDVVYVFNTITGTFNVARSLQLPGKADLRLFTLNWIGRKEYWVTYNNGIVRFDEHLAKIAEWRSDENMDAPNALPPNVSYAFRSKEGMIFIGNFIGLVIINPYLQVFKTYNFPVTSQPGNSAGTIASIAFGDGSIIAGSLYGNALHILDTNWQPQQTIPNFAPFSPGEKSSSVYDMAEDENGMVWMATFQGLIKFNAATRQYTVFLPPASDPLFFRHKRFLIVRPSHDGKIWLANYKQDLLCFDTKTETFKIYTPFNVAKSVWGLVVTSTNQVWITSGNTLAKYNSRSDKFEIVASKEAADLDLEFMTEGKNNELWIASSYGIWRYNTATGEWRNWNTADGLCNNYVNKLLFDKKAHLWITTDNGLSAFDTTQKIFYNFTSQEGLPIDQWTDAFVANNNGTMFLGGGNIVTFFNPSDAIRPSGNYPSYITGCQVNGSNYILPTGANRNISLGYGENNLNFQFTVVNLLQPFQTSYYYKLENFDKEWHLSATGVINYTNLYPGKYVLRVSSNPAGADPKHNDALFITINSPFWKAWWFIAGIVLLITGSVTLGVRMRIKNIRREANRRAEISQQVADLRMRALRSQMNPHFLFNSLNAIQECCLTGQVDVATQYLARFSKLMRFILENSGRQWISLQEEMEMLMLYLDVESLRFTSSFNYYIENKTSLNEGLIKIPPMLVQPFAENAIWHGLLHKTGERQLWIRFYNNDEKLFIEVEDNGVGRRDKESASHKSMGMGIVKERMKLIEEIQKAGAFMEIIDKKDDDNNPTGTLIKLTLPLF